MTVTDVLPSGTTLVATSVSQGACSGTTTVIFSLGTLAHGGDASIVLTIQPQSAGTFTDTATVASTTTDLSPANSSSSAAAIILPASAILALSGWMLLALAMMLSCIGVLKLNR